MIEKKILFPLRDVTAIILAGGQSRRMNTDKKFLRINNLTLLENAVSNAERFFSHVLLSVSRGSDLHFGPFPVVRDGIEGTGPLSGILSGLESSPTNLNFVCASDIPEFSSALITKMYRLTGNHDIVVPVSGDEKYEPLFGFYSKEIIPGLRRYLDSGMKKISGLYENVNTGFVRMDDTSWYFNINTREDLERYLLYLGEKEVTAGPTPGSM